MIVEEQISIVEEQISARQQRARKAIQKILRGPVGQAYGDYKVMGDLDALARKWQQEDAHLRTKPEGGGKVRGQHAQVREGAHA